MYRGACFAKAARGWETSFLARNCFYLEKPGKRAKGRLLAPWSKIEGSGKRPPRRVGMMWRRETARRLLAIFAGSAGCFPYLSVMRCLSPLENQSNPTSVSRLKTTGCSRQQPLRKLLLTGRILSWPNF